MLTRSYAAIFVVIGFVYRWASFVFFLGMSYLFLIEASGGGCGGDVARADAAAGIQPSQPHLPHVLHGVCDAVPAGELHLLGGRVAVAQESCLENVSAVGDFHSSPCSSRCRFPSYASCCRIYLYFLRYLLFVVYEFAAVVKVQLFSVSPAYCTCLCKRTSLR